ncbi:MAG: 1-phosphofructokinase family hexose kinase [Myxococcota bacterium]
MVDVVTVTLNPAVDRSAVVERVFAEHKLRCSDPALEPGGGGINVARALVRLGTTSLALWTSGGGTGLLLGRLLDSEGLPHEPIEIVEETRENFSVYESSSSLQFRFNLPGPIFTEDCQDRVVERLSNLKPLPKFVVLSGSLPRGVPQDFYGKLAASVSAPARVVVDTSGPALTGTLGSPVFAFKPNLRELGQWVGRELEDDAAIVDAARSVLDRSPTELLLVSLGAGGAVVVGRQSHLQVRAPTVPIRSKVGAGDSMVAGFVHGLCQGFSPEDAARFGVAAGAAAVMTDGSQLCHPDDTQRLFQQILNEAGAPHETA